MLAAAFDEAERQPALQEGRDQALEQVSRGAPPHEVGERSVEADVGLDLRDRPRRRPAARAAGAFAASPTAIERLGPGAVVAILRTAPAFDFFEANGGLDLAPDRFRVHALDVQRAADRIAELSGIGDRDELALAALLHDIGRLVIARLHPGLRRALRRRGATPEERIAEERRELGIDHALVGGVLARRWNIHARIARGDRAPPRRRGRGPGRRDPRRRHGRPPHRGLPGLAPRT